jgi:RNA polymerase sigma factor (sigma-70 family)
VRHQPLTNVLQQYRSRAAVRELRDLPDAELLDRFVARHDEAAFAVLMRRHSGLVLGVCRRLLHHVQDAEDACQTTFLVLARKAGSICRRASLSCWLHGVAYRVALRLQNGAGRPTGPPLGAIDCAQADTSAAVTWHEALHILDEELDRLPAHYRAPLVLCYLEGKTQDEAAHQLGWTLGAFRGRLERGRDRLRQRLTRRGITLPAALLGVVVTSSASTAALPAPLLAATVQAARALAAGQAVAPGVLSARVVALKEGVLLTMLVNKLKSAVAVLLLVALLSAGVGVGLLAYRAQAAGPAPAQPTPPPRAEPGGEAKPPAQGPAWAVVKTPFYHLHYDRAHKKDADLAHERLGKLIEVLRKEFAGHPVDKLLQGIDCNIYLYPKANAKASEGMALLQTGVQKDTYVATIHLLTPSVFRPDFRNSVGEPGGEDYFAKLLSHEYGTILLERITRARPKGWRFYDAPSWFVQGYEEYLGLTLSTPHNREVVLPKYLAFQKKDARRVRIGFGIAVRDVYIDGAALLHFMHEAFGKEKVQAILASDADTFEAAAGPALGVSVEEFQRRWEEWRKKLP